MRRKFSLVKTNWFDWFCAFWPIENLEKFPCLVAIWTAGVKFAFFGNLVLFDLTVGSGYRAVWSGFPRARVSYVLST